MVRVEFKGRGERKQCTVEYTTVKLIFPGIKTEHSPGHFFSGNRNRAAEYTYLLTPSFLSPTFFMGFVFLTTKWRNNYFHSRSEFSLSFPPLLYSYVRTTFSFHVLNCWHFACIFGSSSSKVSCRIVAICCIPSHCVKKSMFGLFR